MPPSRYTQTNLVVEALNAAHSLNDMEPMNFQEAIDSPNAQQWINAMNEEMASHEMN